MAFQTTALLIRYLFQYGINPAAYCEFCRNLKGRPPLIRWLQVNSPLSTPAVYIQIKWSDWSSKQICVWQNTLGYFVYVCSYREMGLLSGLHHETYNCSMLKYWPYKGVILILKYLVQNLILNVFILSIKWFKIDMVFNILSVFVWVRRRSLVSLSCCLAKSRWVSLVQHKDHSFQFS